MVGRYSPGKASVQYEINMHVLPVNEGASHNRGNDNVAEKSDSWKRITRV